MHRVNIGDMVNRAFDLHHKKGDIESAERIYNEILNHAPTNLDMILQLAQLNQQKGYLGMAIILYQRFLDGKSDNADVWNNMACCLKNLHLDDSAEFCFKKAMALEADNPDFPANISGLYVNNGTPDKIIEWADKAIAIGPQNRPSVVQARWHKALALLESGRFKEAWPYHEARLEEGAGCKLSTRNYADEGVTPWWDGKSKGLVVIHGEQGLGDELMFASCLPDAIATGAEIVVEPAPRIAGLLQRSFPQVKVYGTHEADGKSWRNGRKVDFKCALGTLPKFYRNNVTDFPGTAYLVPDPERVRRYRERLDALGPRPKIGIAWQGGVLKTRIDLRSIALQQLLPILSQDADFISLQYHQTAQLDVEEFFERTGINIHHWPEAAVGYDMDDQAALVANLDLVITVCQTCNHIAGGLGVPTWILTPSRPSWREGLKGDMPWYKSVTMYRQPGNDWAPAIDRVAKDLKIKLTEQHAKDLHRLRPTAAGFV